MKDYRDIISANAARLRALHDEIARTCEIEPHGKAHQAACAAFHSQYDSLAFPDGWGSSLEQLKAGDPAVVDIAVQLLEVLPRFFRSGYMAETILRRLKHVELTKDQRTRLVGVILNSIRKGGRRIFSDSVRLAVVLNDPRIESGARSLLDDPNPETQRRVKRVLEALQKKEK